MYPVETSREVSRIESCLETIGSAIAYLIKPERNLFSSSGHEDYAKTLLELKDTANKVMLCIGYNPVLTYAFPFELEPESHTVLSLPNYHACSEEWTLVCNERIKEDLNFKDSLQNEVYWRQSYAEILIKYFHGACNHQSAMKQLSESKTNSMASFEEALNFTLDMSCHLSLVAFHENSVVELILDRDFDKMEITTHLG